MPQIGIQQIILPQICISLCIYFLIFGIWLCTFSLGPQSTQIIELSSAQTQWFTIKVTNSTFQNNESSSINKSSSNARFQNESDMVPTFHTCLEMCDWSHTLFYMLPMCKAYAIRILIRWRIRGLNSISAFVRCRRTSGMRVHSRRYMLEFFSLF